MENAYTVMVQMLLKM